MAKEMLINVAEAEECRIAIVENGRLEELYMERTSATSHVGNIYKGRVTNVEPSIQAAFIDFGIGRNGFLHISDLMPSYFGPRGGDIQEAVGHKLARRDRPPIQKCLRRGDEITVQVIKEGIGTKGPTLSTYLSIPGRILVMMPGMTRLGVSRKIEDDAERRRLRQILEELDPPRDCGFIIRTAGVGKTKAEIQKDLSYLVRLWQSIQKKRDSSAAPVELYTEGDLVTRTVRDVFTSDIARIVVDSRDVARRIKEFFKIAMPRTKCTIELYEEPVPLFHRYSIEREIEMMYSRHVPLPSGGSLVIDSTEAIVAIDVNSGRFREHADAEMTAFKTDLEAADEIPRQLRLRDLGGVIICDFIDLRYERHRREVEKRLHENLKRDRAKTKVLRMSQFGIIEMTRQRMRPSLKRSIYGDCPYCKGTGLVKTPESMGLDVMRRLAVAAYDRRVARIDLAVCPEVGFFLNNRKRAAIADLERSCNKKITVSIDNSLAMEDVRLDLYDQRDGLVYLEELGMAAPAAAPQRDARQPRQRGEERRARESPAGAEDIEERFDIETFYEESAEQPKPAGAENPPAPAASEPAGPPAAQGEGAAAPAVAPAAVAPPSPRPSRSRMRGSRGRRESAVADARAEHPAAPGVQPEAAPAPPAPAETRTAAAASQPPAPAQPVAPAASSPEPVAPPAETADGSARGRRRTRGRRRKAADVVAQPSPQPPAPSAALPAGQTSAPPAEPQRQASRGSMPADRHLVHDEPVMPQPLPRPRTYRDLDSIPDDFE